MQLVTLVRIYKIYIIQCMLLTAGTHVANVDEGLVRA